MTDEKRWRVLLVDDEENVRISLAMLLEDQNFEVIEAATVPEARALIAKDCSFDFALLDRRVGRETGTDLIPLIKSTCPDAAIFVLSGSTNANKIDGADAVIDKMESPRAVLDQIESFLARKR